MLFNSIDFLIFLPLVAALYFLLPNKVRNIWLLLASYFFYMCWNARYALLILASTAATYACALLLEKTKRSASGQAKRKWIIAACLVFNLGILFCFKYLNFTLSLLTRAFARIHIELNAPVFDLILPVGISFYTFQAIGYTLDVYRNEIPAERNFLRYALFVSFFPQLVAGPIERSGNLLRQLEAPRKFSFEDAREGFFLVLWGYFLKIVLADRIAIFVDTVYGDYAAYGGFYLLAATALFAVQIYCLVTLLLTAGMVHALGILLRPIDTDIVFNSIDTFHDMPENSMEVIGYGSSHMWTGMSSMEMYEKYGIGAYNYGCHWQVINTTALFIKDSLRTQSPKVILVETFLVNELRQDTSMNKAVEIYCTKAMPDFDGKRQYLKQCFGNDLENYFSYYVPLCAFHENWVNLCRESFLKNSDDTDFYASMGYLCRDAVTPVSIADPSSFEQKPLSADAIACLDDIVSLCRERDIEIIFYTAPWEGIYNYADAMTEYAAENDCVYLNLFEYMDEIGLDCETDFFDPGHLNDRGTVKVSDFLGGYIVNHYDITDMRTVEGNLWEQNH